MCELECVRQQIIDYLRNAIDVAMNTQIHDVIIIKRKVFEATENVYTLTLCLVILNLD
jgi:hypothetical protein